MPLLEIKSLSCSVPTSSHLSFRQKRKQILKQVSLAIDEGTTLGLLGGSGSGKSTIARCIAGIQQPDEGTIRFSEINLFPLIENRKRISLQIQMLFQASSASLNPVLSVRESLLEGIEAGLHSRSSPTVEGLLQSVGLPEEMLDRFPRQLSGGQRQRVALARVLSVHPRLLILDEPTSALDVITQQHILSLLKQLQQKYRFAFLFITHEVQTALLFCDRIAVLNDGEIVDEGESTQLLHHQSAAFTRQLFTDCGINS